MSDQKFKPATAVEIHRTPRGFVVRTIIDGRVRRANGQLFAQLEDALVDASLELGERGILVSREAPETEPSREPTGAA